MNWKNEWKKPFAYFNGEMITLSEYVILEKLKDELQVATAEPHSISQFVQKHYLKKMPTAIKKVFSINHQQMGQSTMIGMVIYGAVFPTVAKSLQAIAKPEEIWELKRLYIDDVGLRNAESYVIGQTLNLIRKENPEVKLVITFADGKVGHVGGIYQATNAIYLGQTSDGKHKYVYVMNGDKNIIQALQPKPYPKKQVPPPDDTQTQLKKANESCEQHFPGAIKSYQQYFGIIKKDPARKINTWEK